MANAYGVWRIMLKRHGGLVGADVGKVPTAVRLQLPKIDKIGYTGTWQKLGQSA